MSEQTPTEVPKLEAGGDALLPPSTAYDSETWAPIQYMKDEQRREAALRQASTDRTARREAARAAEQQADKDARKERLKTTGTLIATGAAIVGTAMLGVNALDNHIQEVNDKDKQLYEQDQEIQRQLQNGEEGPIKNLDLDNNTVTIEGPRLG